MNAPVSHRSELPVHTLPMANRETVARNLPGDLGRFTYIFSSACRGNLIGCVLALADTSLALAWQPRPPQHMVVERNRIGDQEKIKPEALTFRLTMRIRKVLLHRNDGLKSVGV
jgi:hypothetical protein